MDPILGRHAAFWTLRVERLRRDVAQVPNGVHVDDAVSGRADTERSTQRHGTSARDDGASRLGPRARATGRSTAQFALATVTLPFIDSTSLLRATCGSSPTHSPISCRGVISGATIRCRAFRAWQYHRPPRRRIRGHKSSVYSIPARHGRATHTRGLQLCTKSARHPGGVQNVEKLRTPIRYARPVR